MPERELLVRIVGDDRSLQQAFARSSRSAQQFESRTATVGRNLKSGFAAAGVGLSATAIVAFSRSAINAASDLNEEITKSEKVFGDSADEIRSWSETTASSIGIAQTQALQATGIFGNLFNTVGLSSQQGAEMSKTLTELAADLASFNNADISDVLLAIRSGLIGEAEPLRRYGVLLSEARVQQRAMADTGKTSARSLTDQEKALARYKIILQDTLPAQGDFRDTASGLANQQRIAAAETQELATTIGQALLPVEQAALIATIGLVGGINDLIDALGGVRAELRQTDFADGWNNAIDGAAQHAGDFLQRLRDGIPFLIEFRDKVRGAFDDLNTLSSDERTFKPGPISQAREEAAGRTTAKEQADKRAGDATIARIERQAAAQRDLNRQLQDSITRAAHLRDLIRADPDNVKLQQRLTNELQTQQRLRQQIATDAKNAAAADARAAETARENARQAARDAAEARRTRIQAAQFRAIGLTATGEQRVPGIAALRRRGRGLLDQIVGTDLDTARNRSRIGAIFSKQFKDAGREVRQAILEMFQQISAALEEGHKSTQKQQTKFRVANTSEILGGLGLSESEQQQLRRRLSKLGPGGTLGSASSHGGAFGVDVAGGGNVVVTGPVTVIANDPEEFGRKLERKNRRNAGARTGPFAGRK